MILAGEELLKTIICRSKESLNRAGYLQEELYPIE